MMALVPHTQEEVREITLGGRVGMIEALVEVSALPLYYLHFDFQLRPASLILTVLLISGQARRPPPTGFLFSSFPFRFVFESPLFLQQSLVYVLNACFLLY